MTLMVTMRMRNNAYGNECEEVDEELERMHQWFIGLDTVNLK